MLIPEEINGRRIYCDQDTGRKALSVTWIAKDVVAPDGDEYGGHGLSALMQMHSMEGEGCHAAALGWLAMQAGWVHTFTVPEKPALHPDERRWNNVIANAVAGFSQWCEQREVIPYAIEQPSVNWRYGIAGCPDLKCSLEYRGKRVMALPDLKFGKPMEAHHVQVRLYRHLDGYEDCRMGFLVYISRDDGTVKEVPIFWSEYPELDAKALCSAGRFR
jgi:hypothetical protein